MKPNPLHPKRALPLICGSFVATAARAKKPLALRVPPDSGFLHPSALTSSRRLPGDATFAAELISGSTWHADHVLAHSTGAAHRADNYLPAHALCNNYRWDYSAEEFQHILKLGVWTRTQIERRTRFGRDATAAFLAYDRTRQARRTSAIPSSRSQT